MDFESAPANFGEYQLTYRSGDVVIPRIDALRAARPRAAGLRARDPHGRGPRSNAALGLEIVYVLEASAASMRRNGAPIVIGPARDKVAA